MVKLRHNFCKRGASGGRFLDTFVNKIPFEKHLPGHIFMGPGIKLYITLNSDGMLKDWSTPINRVDNAAYHHDLCYSKHDDTMNQICDKTMLNELN